MCGIYGAISLGGVETVKLDDGKTAVVPSIPWDMSAIKALTWANRERGTESLGFFDSSGRMIKRAVDPSDALQDEKVKRWLQCSVNNAWAIGGHTRYATQGSVVKRNAHPFQYGDIIGSHNGMVQSPNKYEVDSEYLIDLINTGGYCALETAKGYWGLSWFNRADTSFYLTRHTGTLSILVHEGVCYYSSDGKHLASVFDGEIADLKEGQVLQFRQDGTILDSEKGEIPAIKAAHDYWDWEGWTGSGRRYRQYPKTGRGRTATDSGTTKSTDGTLIRTYNSCPEATSSKSQTNLLDDWDGETQDEWNQAWDQYFHSMSDDEFKAWENLG